ncbi:MAG: hypothetical protein WA053_00130 [Minisyncoccia bacterium]
MKITHRGFVAPLLLVIIAFMLVGGGAYVYTQKNETSPAVSGSATELPQATSTAQSLTESTSIPLTEFISKNEGRYPSEINLFSNQEVSTRLRTLLGATYEPVMKNSQVQTPIVKISEGIYKTVTFPAHAGGSYDISIYFDIKKDNINVLIDQSGLVQKFSEKGLIDIPEITNTVSQALHITSAYITSGMESDYIMVLGTGFTTSSKAYLSGNGFSGFLNTNYVNDTNVGVSLPQDYRQGLQYDIYISNRGNVISNTIKVSLPPSQG